MAFDRFLIAPINTGLELDLKPFLIPEDAFAKLQNAYVFRGRVRKRFGSYLTGSNNNQLLSRLRIQVGTTTGGALAGVVPGAIFGVGQAFSVGSVIFTVWANGFIQMLRTDLSVAPATYNTANGAFNITGVAVPDGTAVFFYPAEPVMGLTNYNLSAINNQQSYAFDTQFAYVFTLNGWNRSNTGTVPTFHDPSGNKDNYVWATNWEGTTANQDVMFISNFQVTNFNGAVAATDDPLFSFDGTTWAVYTPRFRPTGAPNTGPTVKTARIILPFKDRLLLLNTVETDGVNNTWYPSRCRFSFNGSAFATNAWYEPNTTDGTLSGAGAGFIDATTDEEIVSAEFIKDRLIVYFERSTWELAYTGNQVLPFVWQKINTELGSESTFSSVPFDKVVLTIGNTGVHACSGSNVERIDQKIPDEIFKIHDKEIGPSRIQGIRDYFTEMVYWTFPPDTESNNFNFPESVLVYNYRNGSWAFNDDCLTAFGYFLQSPGQSWASLTNPWPTYTVTWNSGVNQPGFRQIIAGNQEGYILVIDTEISQNASAMQLSLVVNNSSYPGNLQYTIVNHTLTVGEFIYFENVVGNGAIGNLNGFISQVIAVISDNIIIGTKPSPLVVNPTDYQGGGQVKRVSNIQIQSKQWNPYLNEGRNFYLARIDFAVQNTGDFNPDVKGGQITVDYFPSSTTVSMLQNASATGALMGTGILETTAYDPTFYPLETEQERLWHPIYFQTTGECIQIYMYFSDNQMVVPNIVFSAFEMEGLILYTERTSQRLQ